jgi:hypothetical protein
MIVERLPVTFFPLASSLSSSDHSRVFATQDKSTFNISVVILMDENAVFNIDDDFFYLFPNELATVCS